MSPGGTDTCTLDAHPEQLRIFKTLTLLVGADTVAVKSTPLWSCSWCPTEDHRRLKALDVPVCITDSAIDLTANVTIGNLILFSLLLPFIFNVVLHVKFVMVLLNWLGN